MLLLFLASALAAQPLTPDSPAPDALTTPWTSFPAGIWRGVSIEKPTFLILEGREEYLNVKWESCQTVVAEVCGDNKACADIPGQALRYADVRHDGARYGGARAACLTAEALRRWPDMNVVRVPIAPGGFGDPDSEDGWLRHVRSQPDYLNQLVEPIFDVARAAGELRKRPIMVILDWHYVADRMAGPSFIYRKPSKRFWAAVAEDEALRSYPHVVYELLNEPVKALPNPGWQRGMKELYDLVSPTGRPILVGAPGYSKRGAIPYDFMSLVVGPVQVEHCYTNKAWCRTSRNSSMPPSVFATEVGDDDRHLQGFDSSVPATETRAGHIEHLLREYEAKEMHGWVAWQFALGHACPGLLVTPTEPRDLQVLDLSRSGKVVHNLLVGEPAKTLELTGKEPTENCW